MSSLTDDEKRYLEKILDMGGGCVLDYNDRAYGDFFRRHKIDIHSQKYCTYGTSKARKMRAFWEIQSDAVVGKALSEMLDSYEASCELDGKKANTKLLQRARNIVGRLTGNSQKTKASSAGEEFLYEKFVIPSVQNLPIEQAVMPIINDRLKETKKAFEAGAYLSVVVLCGSILEGVLLGKAQQNPKRFNSSKASPKARDGKVKQFPEWTLANFIDVASEVGVLKPDVKKFGHGLRDFRNYIHPYQEMVSDFKPDKHTAAVCFQVLKAALANVAGER